MSEQTDISTGAASAVQEAEPMLWQVRLGDVHPARRWIVLLMAFLAGTAGYLLFRQVLVALIGFGAIIASTTEVLLPTKFRIDSSGVRAHCGFSVTSLDWSNVKRIIPDEVGVLLSPLAEAGRLDAFRGVYLRFAGNRQEVLAKIREFTNGDE